MTAPAPTPPRETLRQLADPRLTEDDGAAWPPLRSLDLFKDRWIDLRAQRRLALELPPPPENAGPLNSQRLLHDTLQCLRDISPAYLLHLAQHVEGLASLEAAVGLKLPAAPGRPAETSRRAPGRRRPG